MESKEQKTVNGVNVTQLVENINAIQETPELSEFKFRVTNRWIEGTYNQATVNNFYGVNQEHGGRNPMVYDIDEPPVLLGGDKGPNPVEYLLVGLSGCVTTAMVAHAAARGIEIKSLETFLEGDLNVQGFLGLSDTIPVGYQGITVTFKIEAEMSDAEKESLIELAQQYSPVLSSLINPVPVHLKLHKGP
ncbi:MAG: OsmC family protein [Desulfuromonadales bacterium]